LAALVARAVGHLKQYPAATLDAGTLRTLAGDTRDWLAELARVSKGVCDAEAREEFDAIMAEDRTAAEAALGSILAELAARKLG
jgi:hypothetical protein